MRPNEPVRSTFALNHNTAMAMVQAAEAKAREIGVRLNIAVADAGGNLLAFLRMDGAPLLSGEIARNKAYTAAAFGKATGDWYGFIKDEPALLHGIVHTDRLVIFGGGLPIYYGEHLLGGIGCSGGSSEEDTICARAGLAVLENHSSS
ncbi:cobalamin adenosyltransferase [Kyrpidia spormannii]|uniref:Cobalamin adenosyltransferase n=1 Tax=Kyrpidia spormannii TaxID=2055160 RepID=A0A2K8N7X3_9BACL|nr:MULTISPECIES: heme-binding protein [Kyrpidia]ATY85434.1 cobalamin adenosyltransferase [Kyrpidia spormannii]MCL6575425.1 heme-binding protein [Kyrpidia sp.]